MPREGLAATGGHGATSGSFLGCRGVVVHPWGRAGSRDSSAPSRPPKESDPPVALPRGGFSPRTGVMCRLTPQLGEALEVLGPTSPCCPPPGGGLRLCPQQPPGPAGDGARQVGAGRAEAPQAVAAGQDPGALPRPPGRSLARPAAPGSSPRPLYPFEPPMTVSAQDGVAGPVGPPWPNPAEVDVDSLVPTHDERGRLIPEWKRQVMVRRLRARLADEDPAGGQVRGARGVEGARAV